MINVHYYFKRFYLSSFRTIFLKWAEELQLDIKFELVSKNNLLISNFFC